MNRLIAVLTALVLCTAATAQTNWKLKKDEDGIQVYTGSTETSAFRSVKVTCVVNARPSQLVALLLDVKNQPSWVYNAKESRLLRVIQPNEILFYSHVDVPWPCDDRDYVSHFTVKQVNPNLVVLEARSEPDHVPVNKGIVRVKKSSARWEMTTLPGDRLQIVYTVSIDPGGAVPAWLTNLFVTKGPFESFQKLRANLGKAQYKDSNFAFIKEQA